MKKNNMNRRKFVKAAATTVVGTAALAGCSSLGLKTSRKPSEYVGNWNVDESDKFDFIIVGSGAGGGPLAAGLAKAGYRVLLLEAGKSSTNELSQTPVFHTKASEDPLLNWSYFVERYGDDSRFKAYERTNSKFQKKEQGVYYPRASGLGGCTRVNALISLYPDHQDWANLSQQLNGDIKFSPQAMAKVFKDMQLGNSKNSWLNLTQADPKTLIKDRFLIKMALAAISVDGPGSELKKVIEDLNLINPFIIKNPFDTNPLNQTLKNLFNSVLGRTLDFIDTATDANLELFNKAIREDQNFKLNPNHAGYADIKSGKHNGVFSIPFNATDGVRKGVRDYIIETEASYQDKLFIKTEALCTRIIFDSTNTKAIGIEFIEGAHSYKADVLNQDKSSSSYVKKVALVDKDIILSGGAFNTPQLLMLSGVGPDKDIPAGIPRVKNLPGVGKNLQDRYEVTVVSQLKEPISIIKDCTFARNNDFESDPCWKDYQKDPANHLYGTNGVALSLIRKSSMSQPTPDLCIFGLPGYFKGYYPHYSHDTTPKKAGDPSYFTWAVLKGHTKNHAGSVTLKTSDPKDTPKINFKYFHDDKSGGLTEDLNAVFAGLKVARDINQKIGSKYFKNEEYPGPQVKTDAQLKSWIMQEAWGHHASCTNKMGPASDPMAVVDNKFKVHGLKNLRIVDASVFPDIPGLFIMLPTLMMSEKAKEIILEEYGQRS
jgi:choline dehydrogenase